MMFRDYITLLYRAYLDDRGILKTLRDKLKDGSYLQDLEDSGVPASGVTRGGQPRLRRG